jgi:hypothetical protein
MYQACCDLFRGWNPEETLCDPQDCQGAHNYCGVHPVQSIMRTLTLSAKWPNVKLTVTAIS